MSTHLHWFRKDLRLADNTALRKAIEHADSVVPCFIFPAGPGAQALGTGARAWLDRSLVSLDASLKERGSALVVRSGEAATEIERLVRESGATAVHCQRDWAPSALAEEEAVARRLSELGVALHVSPGQLLVAPDAITTSSGGSYHVFTPFLRTWRARVMPIPVQTPDEIPAPPLMPASSGPLSSLPGGPDIDRWWVPGEQSAQIRLHDFVHGALADYDVMHDRPDIDGTSALSMRLAWGELSPAQVFHAVHASDLPSAESFIRQLGWREFSYHVMHHFPRLGTVSMHQRFDAFPWAEDPKGLAAWKAGRTGFALVDAGMRQLLATGWIHNRARMVCASFLVKDLLIDWREGEKHFRERLIDHDEAVNAFNWQWIAGSGADAAPYFRIFNPTTQAKKFDPAGEYVRMWAPDWSTTEAIIDHAQARERALAARSQLDDQRI